MARRSMPFLIVLMATCALASAAEAKTAKHAHASAPKPAACDRACLTALTDRYMDALAAQKPASLAWATTVRSSENNVPIMVGDGVWATASAHSQAALRAADPETGQAVWMGEVEEHGQPAFLALRLKIESGKIAEAEMIVRRKGGPPQYGVPESQVHDPAFAQAAPGKRKALVALVDGYFDGLQGGGASRTRFDPHCARQDNGVPTTSGETAEGRVQGCEAQFKAGVFKPIGRVRDRRFPVVDEERGVVIAAGFMDLPAKSEPPPAGEGLTWAESYPYSISFIAAFKVRDGRIWRIESISDAVPYLMPSPYR